MIYMGLSFFLLGLAIFLFSMWFFVTILGGDVRYLLDIASLLMIILPLVAVLTATRSFRVFFGGLQAVISPQKAVSDELRGQAASLFRYLSKTTGLVMVISVFISWTNMLFNLNFADAGGLAMIGLNLAAALITPLQGLILIAAVFEPMVFILKRRSAKER